MGWDEKIFSWFYDGLLARKDKPRNSLAILPLSEVQKRLQILCSAIAEKNIEIRGTHSWGGLQGSILFLPQKLQFAEDLQTHIDFYLWRGIIAAVAIEKKISTNEEWETQVFSSYPELKTLFHKLLPYFPENIEPLWGHLPQNKTQQDKGKSENPTPKKIQQDALPKGTEVEGQTKEKASLHRITEEQESPLTHVFEKVHTAEEYQGGDRKMDGQDEILDHQEALKELTLSHVVRTDRSTDSIYKSSAIIEVADLSLDEDPSNKELLFSYPEWFVREKNYRQNWCTVHESDLQGPSQNISYSKKTAQDLKLRLQQLVNESYWIPRQLEGEEVDLPAAIDRCAQMRVGGNTSDRIYLTQRKRERNLATLILVDSSLSTDSWVKGQRVLNLMQDCLLTLHHTLKDTNDMISIASFNSNTRLHCHYQFIKKFDEDWTQTAERISQIKPSGYTRIGSALRHSSYLLNQTGARKKLLLLLSDAKPTDYDHYEGQHGISDIRKAILEAQGYSQHVKVLGFADKRSQHHDYCFGTGNFFYLNDARSLSEHIFTIWSQALKI